MSVRSKVKVNARKAMTQNFIKSLSVTLILISVALLYAVFVMVANMVVELFIGPLGGRGILDDWNYLYSPILVGVSFLVQLVLFSPLVIGCAGWFYRLVGDENTDVIDLFDHFSGIRRYFGSLWFQLNLAVRSFFYSFLFTAVPVAVLGMGYLLITGRWVSQDFSAPLSVLLGSMLMIAGTVLFIALGIFAWVFLKRYFLAPYLYAAGDCSVRQAFKQSVYFMKGHKGELFLFDLSFIGWFLCCIVLVPILYVFPYYTSASALYARVLIERGQREKEVSVQEPTLEFDQSKGQDEHPSDTQEEPDGGTAGEPDTGEPREDGKGEA